MTLGEVKRSNIIKFQLPCQFQRLLFQTLCVFSQNERYKIYHMGFSFSRLGHAPGVGLRGAGGALGSKIIFFTNMVMWHINSTGMKSRTECK